MNTTVEKYIAGLKQAYYVNDYGKEDWNHFEKVKHGAKKEDLEQLKKIYPDIPNTLIALLEYVDGTFWREYAGEEITFFFLGSDLREYPYYLLSSNQMMESQHKASNNYSEYIDREYEEVEIDDKITTKSKEINWLHFSDCMNNGGTSQLFIDFSPSPTGTKGQVVMFLHDPDELTVIADSFDAYLQKLMDKEYDFILEDMFE